MARTILFRCHFLSAFGLMGALIAIVIPAATRAQSATPAGAAQIAGGSPFVALRGNTHPLARPVFDQGRAPDGIEADRQVLLLKRSPQQEAALESFLQRVQDPGSPDYRKFMTPEQFGRVYGPSDSDLQTVVSWLHGQGFTIERVNKGRTAIEFSGTVAQLQIAFHTAIHRFVIGTHDHWANISDPMIPAALAPLVAEVASLNDFGKPRSYLVPGPKGTWNPTHHRFEPELTVTSSGINYLFVAPGDAATIYDAPDSLNTKLQAGQTAYDGTGVTIGIVSNSDLYYDSFANYRSLFGLSDLPLSLVYDGNQANLSTASDTEALLDTEVSGALAPGAKIQVYEAGDTLFQSGVLLAAYRAIEDNEVSILNVSFGACESDLGAAGNQEVLSLWQQAAAQGITVVVASGDSGSAGCDDPNTETVASHGLAVNGLASTPYNIAVGGTDFDVLPGQFSTYVSAPNSSNYTSALSYIPEEPWNDSTSTNGSLSSNIAETVSGQTNIAAGGGGASSNGNLNANNNLSGYPKPAWQAGYPLSDTDAVRDVPDVSLFAATGMYRAAWALCGDSDCSGSNPTISGVGGTSASTAAFTGILAIVNQKVGASVRLGQAAWVLYRLAQTQPAVFHEITSGNNSVYCTAGSANCGSNSFLTGYNAGAGFSLASGLGSVDISQLVNDWSNVSLTSTQATLSLSETSFVHGTPINITTSVNPSGATGNVAVINNSGSQTGATTNSAPTNPPLVAGSATGTYAEFPGGTYNVYANYPGDGTYAGSISPGVKVAVSPEDSILNFSGYEINSNSEAVSLSGQTVPLGTSIVLSAQPVGNAEAASKNPVTNATGNVALTDSVTNLGYTIPLDSSGDAIMQTQTLIAGAHTFTAQYLGDNSYNQSPPSGPVSFSITKAPTTVTVTASASSIYSGQVVIDAQMSANLPFSALNFFGGISTGTITFTDTTSNTVLGTSSSFGGFCTPGQANCVSGALDVNVDQLVMGTNSIVASFGGNNNFEASPPSAPVAVACTAGCSNGTGQTIQFSSYHVSSGSIAPGGAITATVSANPGGGFTGAVNLTCSVTGKNASDVDLPTCSFNPTQVNVTSPTVAVNSTLTINTTAASASFLHVPRTFLWSRGSGSVLAILLMFGIRGLRRNPSRFLGVFLLFFLLATTSACGGGGTSTGGGGGGGSGGGGNPGTTADTYTVTFHASDAATGTVTAQDYFNFTVN